MIPKDDKIPYVSRPLKKETAVLDNTRPRTVKELASTINHLSPDEVIHEFVTAYLYENPTWYENKSKIFWAWNTEEYKWEIIDDVVVLRNFTYRYSILSWIDPRIRNKIIEPLKVCASRKPKDQPIEWIQFKNKVYDINTKKEFEATPGYFFTTPLPHELGVTEETPTIDKMFSEWVSQDDIKALYELAAYCLYRGYPIQRVFVLHGAGSNGKGTYLSLLRVLLGIVNVTSTDYERIADPNQRFERVKLLNKLVCMLGELEASMFKRTSTLKELSSGTDLISGEIKGKCPFDFLNYAKIIISTNSIPMTADKSDGFYRRFNIIDFKNQFTIEKEILSEIPGGEFSNMLLKLVRILPGVISSGKFINDGSIIDRKIKYESLSNPLKQFIEDYYIRDLESYTIKSEFTVDFLQYLHEHKLKPMNDKEITFGLKCCGYDVKLKRMGLDVARVIDCLRVRTESDNNE